ncbi:MAG: cell division protein FtsH, partial [Bacteroidaceae bacterium]
NNQEYQFDKPYSNKTAELIDEEVKKLISEQYERAKSILSQHQDGHGQLARLLIEREVIFADDVENIFGKRPWVSRTEELLAENDKREAEKAEAEFAEQAKLAEQANEEETPDIDPALEAQITAIIEENENTSTTMGAGSKEQKKENETEEK